ncbi:MAG: hypothetical protein J6B31_02245 [Bacteroidaceae bacterium]|nr:hypothetical protein [Bacteroidaceae bacterium]
MKTLLYLHGLSSSGQSNTPDMLRKFLPDWNIVSPDIPIDPKEALQMLHRLCEDIKPDCVVGTSMGGMFAQQMHGYRKILVNPAFHVSEIMRQNLGVQPFFSPRKDGATEYTITPELCDAYEAMEAKQFDGILPQDKETTMALFGTEDDLVNGREEYFQYYSYGTMFEGGHRLTMKVVENVLLKLIYLNGQWAVYKKIAI